MRKKLNRYKILELFYNCSVKILKIYSKNGYNFADHQFSRPTICAYLGDPYTCIKNNET